MGDPSANERGVTMGEITEPLFLHSVNRDKSSAVNVLAVDILCPCFGQERKGNEKAALGSVFQNLVPYSRSKRSYSRESKTFTWLKW